MISPYSTLYSTPKRLNHAPIAASGLVGPTRPATVSGSTMTLEAKMIGMTPALLTRNGMWVLAPPYMRRPTMRLAYWTGILRVAWVMRMTAAITATIMTSTKAMVNSDTVPAAALFQPL